MAKQVLIVSLLVLMLTSTEGRAQNEKLDSLNYFKYVVVETLFYDNNMVVDKYSISGNVRKHFLEKGFTVLTETKRYWPEELFENPCLALYCDIEPTSGMFTKYKVLIKLSDCNGRLIYSMFGKGSGDTETEAYKMAADRAFYQFDKWDYHYTSGNTIKLVEKRANKKLAGFYESIGEQSGLKIEIVPVNDFLEARVIHSENRKFKEGRLLATFRSSTLGGNLYIVNWVPETKESYETLANYEKESGRLSIELKEKNQTKKIVFRKIE